MNAFDIDVQGIVIDVANLLQNKLNDSDYEAVYKLIESIPTRDLKEFMREE